MQLLNEQFSFLYSDYDKTQLKNNRIHLMRQKEIREKIPAYRRLEEEMRDMSVLAARAALEGSHECMADLTEKTELISKQKKELLLQHGYLYLPGLPRHRLCRGQKVPLFSKTNRGISLRAVKFKRSFGY